MKSSILHPARSGVESRCGDESAREMGYGHRVVIRSIVGLGGAMDDGIA